MKFIFSLFFLCLTGLIVNAQDSGHGIGSGNGKTNWSANQNLTITLKPAAAYTETARNKQVQGFVRLKIVFKKDGNIGKIKVVEGLPDGLNERAIEAAKNIRFRPATKNGKPVTVTKMVEYRFTIY